MATQEPKMTASRCTTEAETGVHTFEIIGYSFKRGVGIGSFFQSDTFTVGGHDWAIRFYLDGISHGTRNFVSISLDLMTSPHGGKKWRAPHDPSDPAHSTRNFVSISRNDNRIRTGDAEEVRVRRRAPAEA